MKYILSILVFISISFSSICQQEMGPWGGFYGDIYSFGMELNQNNSKVHYKSDFFSSQEIDTVMNYGYSSILPYLKLHIDIASLKEDDIIYYNFLYGMSINFGSTINGKPNGDNFPAAHYIETGLSYLKGEEFGKAFVGSASLTCIASFNVGEFYVGPTFSAGYQFEIQERLIQLYLKGGFNLIGRIEKSREFSANGYSDAATSTYTGNVFGIGLVYRGIN